MSIAQHFVAGEGTVHPLVEQSSVTHDDEKALIQFNCDTTNLPWIIFRAAFRAEHLAGLPARSRALLATLARTIDAGRPYAAIFARRELLTCRAMQSIRTFYRSLDDLETAGLIVRPPQRRYGEAGLFGRAYLHPSPKRLPGYLASSSQRPPPLLTLNRRCTMKKSRMPLPCRSGLPVWQTVLYIRINPQLHFKRDNQGNCQRTSSACGPWVFMHS
jgi:hypothetical protein